MFCLKGKRVYKTKVFFFKCLTAVMFSCTCASGFFGKTPIPISSHVWLKTKINRGQNIQLTQKEFSSHTPKWE